MEFPPNGKIFAQFFAPFPKSSSNFESFEESMISEVICF